MIMLVFRPDAASAASAAWWVADGELVEEVLAPEDPALDVARTVLFDDPGNGSWEEQLAFLGKGMPKPYGMWESHEVTGDPLAFLAVHTRAALRGRAI